ncbi:hypothetical protein MNEG_3665 [Monoraphidium neglectum]|uniref:Uncharacterized protein n=1 Tax=Monoraphidium neglectum TaxID=145388 RepID=A0A0D2LC10_9CHLO|nr:hypothetical protein MNEG_3665 [Monoraphidium neglectum]KIZ04289.1 hypothetical protein MNEG_3665 [Monoraphidium neglectum]|eukprot:XP_013903308.1 hypothetical protein MNEG_3665 [Monoraphidium neglectum]
MADPPPLGPGFEGCRRRRTAGLAQLAPPPDAYFERVVGLVEELVQEQRQRQRAEQQRVRHVGGQEQQRKAQEQHQQHQQQPDAPQLPGRQPAGDGGAGAAPHQGADAALLTFIVRGGLQLQAARAYSSSERDAWLSADARRTQALDARLRALALEEAEAEGGAAAVDALVEAARWDVTAAAARAERAELRAALRELRRAAAPCVPPPRVQRQRPLLSAAQLLECVMAALAIGQTGRVEALLALAGRIGVDWLTLPDPDCSVRGPIPESVPPGPLVFIRCAGWLLRAWEWRQWPLNSVLWAVDSGWLPPQAFVQLLEQLNFIRDNWGPGLALAGSRRVVELSEPLLPAVRLWVLAKSLLLWAVRQPHGAGVLALGRGGAQVGGESGVGEGGCRCSDDAGDDAGLGLFQLVELLEDAGHVSHAQSLQLFFERHNRHQPPHSHQVHQVAEEFRLWVRRHPLRGAPSAAAPAGGEAGGGGGGSGGGCRDEESGGVPGSGCLDPIGSEHVTDPAPADVVCSLDPAIFNMPGSDAPAAGRAAALRAAAAWLRGALTREAALCEAMRAEVGAGVERRPPVVPARCGWLPGAYGSAWLAPQEHWELLLAAAERRDIKTLTLLAALGQPDDCSIASAAAANALAAAAAAGAFGLLPGLLAPLVAAAEAERAGGGEDRWERGALLRAIENARPLTAARDDAPIGEVVDAALLLLRAAEHAGSAEGERVLAVDWLGPEAPRLPAFPPTAYAALRAPAGAGGVVTARVKALLLRMWRDRLEAGEGAPPPPPFGARWARKATFQLVANAGGGGDPDLMFAAVQWARQMDEWRTAVAGGGGGGA